MKKLLATRSQPFKVDLALLIVRVVCGYAFVNHGWGKIQTPMNWMGPESSIPGFFQALAALSEFGGGMALIVGLVTRLGAFGIASTMVVAVYMHSMVFGDPFVSLTGGRSYELASVFLSISLLILAMGPGRFSMDRKIFGVMK